MPASESDCRFSSEWTELMYKHFHRQYATCPLSFTGNRLRKKESRKKRARFWVGRANCKVPNCIAVVFEIRDEPVPNQSVTVHVSITGSCNHANDSENIEDIQVDCDDSNSDSSNPRKRLYKRHLKGSARQYISENLLLTGEDPKTTYYDRLSRMSNDEVRAGNVTFCHTPQVLREAKYERSLKERLAEDMIDELLIVRDAWKDSFQRDRISGFVQSVGHFPFFVTFYIQEQADMYIRDCSQTEYPFIVHYDATGSVMKQMNNQKRSYYYSLIGNHSSIPFLEFISTCHNSRWLGVMIDTFLVDIKKCVPSRELRPCVVVTDFSYAMIYSTLYAFNDMTVIPYLDHTYALLTDPERKLGRKRRTTVVICEAHMMKVMSVRFNRVERTASKRKAAMVIFSRLQRCSSMKVRYTIKRIACYPFRHCDACVLFKWPTRALFH